MIKEFEEIAKKDNYKYQIMPSGASHDCLKMNELFESVLIFIPCKGGISHNPLEYASVENMALGGEIILKYLLKKNQLL